MRATRNLAFFVVTTIVLFSCRKESEIKERLDVGIVAGKAVYRLLCVHHIAEQFGLKLNDNYFSSQTIVHKTDSVYSDGDGVEYWLDFGNGVLCTDGITRRGKCRLQMIDTLFPLKGKVEIDSLDNFSFYTKDGWQRIYGRFSWEKISEDSATVSCALSMQFKNYLGVILSTSNPLGIKYQQPLNYQKTTSKWNGKCELSFGHNGVVLSYTHHNFDLNSQNIGTCRSNWNTGFLQEIGGEDPLKIEFDPFGNEACDQVFKVSRKYKRSTDEMTFDAW